MEQILKVLVLLIDEGISIKNGMNKGGSFQELSDDSIDYGYQKIDRWVSRSMKFLKENISAEEAEKFNSTMGEIFINDLYGNFCREINSRNAFLKSLKDDIEKNPEFWRNHLSKNKKNQEISGQVEINSIDTVRKICSQFHIVAKQLGNYRHENRNTITITDEYDVQDLLHALLKIFFDDIRPEEWTPSYAGRSSRMDFLIKNEKIVIEVKKTREGLIGKQIADQLFIDIERYKKSHPSCEYLFCFVYDPENLIQNPIGFEKDINEEHKGEAEVLICPKGL